MKKKDIIAAHAHCANHRDQVLASESCGCFYCLAIYPPSEIADWIDVKDDKVDLTEVGETALCPKCGIDSVIGSASGFPITEEFLKQMNEYWFQGTMTVEQASRHVRK